MSWWFMRRNVKREVVHFFLLMFCYEWRYESLQVYFPVGNKYIKFLAPYYSWLGEVLNGTKLTWHIQYWWSQQDSIRLEKCKFKSWPISCISMEICQKNQFWKKKFCIWQILDCLVDIKQNFFLSKCYHMCFCIKVKFQSYL